MTTSGRMTGFLVAGLCIVGGLVWLVRSASLLANGARATGTVVQIHQRDDGDGITYSPVVEFTPVGASTPSRFTGSGSNPQLYEVGETVTVVYRPTDLEGAKIHSAIEWGMPLIVLLFGVAVASSLLVARRASGSTSRAAFHEARARARYALGIGGLGAAGALLPLGLPGFLRGVSLLALFGGFLVAAVFHSRTRHCPDCAAPLGGEGGPPIFGALAPCAQCGNSLDGA